MDTAITITTITITTTDTIFLFLLLICFCRVFCGRLFLRCVTTLASTTGTYNCPCDGTLPSGRGGRGLGGGCYCDDRWTVCVVYTYNRSARWIRMTWNLRRGRPAGVEAGTASMIVQLLMLIVGIDCCVFLCRTALDSLWRCTGEAPCREQRCTPFFI